MQPGYTIVSSMPCCKQQSAHLVEHSQLVRGESTHDRVENPSVVEQNHIVFIPILWVNKLVVSAGDTA